MTTQNLSYYSSTGRTNAEWVQYAVTQFKSTLAGAPGTLRIDQSSLAFGASYVEVDAANITLDITGCTISYTDDRVFTFTNCVGGGIVGAGTIQGPLDDEAYGIVATTCSGMVFTDFTVREGNSGVHLRNTSESRVERLKFHEMYATAVKCSGPDAWGNVIVDVEGRNVAGFLVYGDDRATRNRVVNPRKWLDYPYLQANGYTGSGFFARTSPPTIEEAKYRNLDGTFVTRKFVGEEGVGLTAECSHWDIEGGDISGVGDNGISITGHDCEVRGVYVHDNMHDGIHFYGSNNVAINCVAERNGKYSTDETVAVNGYGFSSRPNAGGCAHNNAFVGCRSTDNQKGDSHAGDALFYRPWVSGGTDIERYCYTDLTHDPSGLAKVWRLVWAAEGDELTQFGTTSPTAYDDDPPASGEEVYAPNGIVIDAFGIPTNRRHVIKGTVRWYDGRVWWYWRSSCPPTEGPWAHNTQYRGLRGNHATRRFYQDSAIPADSKATNLMQDMESPTWALGQGDVVVNAAGGGTVLYTTIGETATPDLSMRVQRRNGSGEVVDVGTNTILQKFVGSGWCVANDETTGSYKQVGRLYSVITGEDSLGEPRVAWRINHQPAHHIRAKAISSLTWSSTDGGTASGLTTLNHGQASNTVLRLAIEGAVPAAYNGVYDVTFTGTKNFSYRLAAGSSPGNATTPGTLGGDNNDYVGWSLMPDGRMGLGKYGAEIPSPSAQLEVVDDVAADMFCLRSERVVVDGDIVTIDPSGLNYKRLDIKTSGYIRFGTSAAATINRIESPVAGRGMVVLHNGTAQAVTLKNSADYLNLEGNKDLVLGLNDTVTLLRVTATAGANLWVQTGGKRNSSDAVATSSLTAGTATVATGTITAAGIGSLALLPPPLNEASFDHFATSGVLTLGSRALTELSLTAPLTISEIASALSGNQVVYLRNVSEPVLTFVHNPAKIILTGGGQVELGENDFIVLVRDSGGVWSQIGGSVPRPLRASLGQAGARVIPVTMGIGTTSIEMTEQNLLYFPIRLDVDHAVYGLGVEVLTAVATTSKVHLSLFSHDRASNRPGVLILDAGEVDTDAVGVKVKAFSSPYTPTADGWYWICLQAKGGPKLRASSLGQAVLGLAQSTTLATSIKGLRTAGLSWTDTNGVPVSPVPADTYLEGTSTPLCFAQLS